MGAQRQAHLVPGVHEDVRVVVGGLGKLRHPVHEGDRRVEVAERPLAGDLRRTRQALTVAQALLDLPPRSALLICPSEDLCADRACDPTWLGAMRIASLVPHATELLFALGLGPEVVAVTHECDHPPAA